MNDDNRAQDRRLEERAKQLFDDSVDGLDAGTRSKLTQARYRALEELERPRAVLTWNRGWLPAGMAVAVVLAAVIVWQVQPGRDGSGAFDVAAASDLEILLGDEELEMIQELEFYAWLEEQTEVTGTVGQQDGVG